MSNERKIKTIAFGMIDGSNGRRSHRDGTNDLIDWCRAGLQRLSYYALNVKRWEEIINMALSIIGC